MLAKVKMDNYGVTHCDKCGAEILCNEWGDMPDVCQHCKERLDYSDFKQERNGGAA